MRRLACVALLGIGCTVANPAYHVDDGDSGGQTQGGGSSTSSGPGGAGTDGEGPTADGSSVTSDAVASSSIGGEPDCP